LSGIKVQEEPAAVSKTSVRRQGAQSLQWKEIPVTKPARWQWVRVVLGGGMESLEKEGVILVTEPAR